MLLLCLVFMITCMYSQSPILYYDYYVVIILQVLIGFVLTNWLSTSALIECFKNMQVLQKVARSIFKTLLCLTHACSSPPQWSSSRGVLSTWSILLTWPVVL